MTDVSNGISASGAARLLGLSESTLAKFALMATGLHIANSVGASSTARKTFNHGANRVSLTTPRTLKPGFRRA